MLLTANIKSIFYAGTLALCVSGCSATLEGLKEDLGKVGEKTGLKTDGSDEQVEESSESAESVLTQIQTLLKEKGYYRGEVNGEFSAATEAAIQDFQLDRGLRIDGRATAELLAVLESG